MKQYIDMFTTKRNGRVFSKKLFLIIGGIKLIKVLLIVLIFSLSACGGSGNNSKASPEEKENSAMASKVANNYKEYYLLDIEYDVMGRKGGVEKVLITINNTSPYGVRSLTVAVEYLSGRNDVVETEYITFTDINAGQKATKGAPTFKRCESVRAVINMLNVPAIGLNVLPSVER